MLGAATLEFADDTKTTHDDSKALPGRREPIQRHQLPTSPREPHLYDILSPYHLQKEPRSEISQRSRRNLHTGSMFLHDIDSNPSHLFERNIHKSLLKLRLDMINHGRTQHNGTARHGHVPFHLRSYYFLFLFYEWALMRYSSSFHMNGASWAMEFQIKINS